MYLPGYDIPKAAQAVAYFALKSGGSINVLKLSKLMYLAEREAMKRYDSPMFFDHLVSMPDGPVASITLNFINGANEETIWSKFVSPRAGVEVSAAKDVSVEQMDNLSEADLEILDGLWVQFGKFDRYELRDWTHKKDNVPEWEDPAGSSRPILHGKVFHFLGKDGLALEKDVEDYRNLSHSLAKCS
jgi:uncharacterized phage-associated protein